IFLWFTLPDTPASVGLPEVEGTESIRDDTGQGGDYKAFLMEKVFLNKYIWLISIGNFFVYVLRFAVFDWGTTVLTKAKHFNITEASQIVGIFEISGIVGMLLCGWLTDRVFGGRGSRTCAFCMAFAGIALYYFWKTTSQSVLVNALLLGAVGFFVYGP